MNCIADLDCFKQDFLFNGTVLNPNCLFVTGAVGRSTLQVNNSKELTFSVPKESSKQMATILQRLEEDSETLGEF